MFIHRTTEPTRTPNAALSFQELLRRVSASPLSSEVLHFPLSLNPVAAQHSGSATTPITQSEWAQALFELQDRTAFSWTDDAGASAKTLAAVGEVPLYVAAISYFGPTPRFMTEVVAAFTADREIVIPDDLEDAARRMLFFAAVPLLPSKYEGFSRLPFVHHGQTVIFRLVTPIWQMPGIEPPAALQVDLDDGAGPHRMHWGDAIRTTYGTTGPKNIRVTAHVNGKDLVSLSSFTIGPSLAAPQYNEAWTLSSPTGNGTAWVWYGKGNPSLTRPVIMCEGFPGGYTWDYLFDKYNQENLATDILANGKDFIIVSFGQTARAGIFECAAMLVEVIKRANASKSDPSKIRVGGASMGGLVARCALLQMQHDRIDPQTQALVCFDSPNTGAYVPVSVQTFLWYFAKHYQDAADKLALLSTKSAKQMLVYYAGDGGSGSLVSPERSAFVQQVAALGNYPTGMKKIAVADGRKDGKTQETGGAPENRSLYYHADIDPTVFVWLYNLPTPKSDSVTVSKMYNIEIDFWNVVSFTVQNTYSYDGAPGGLGQMYPDVKNALDGAHCGADADVSLQNNAFIPTVSAVGIGGDPSVPINLSNSPFEHAYLPDSNQDHVKLTAEMKQWLLGFLKG